jgi:hypothetical protein
MKLLFIYDLFKLDCGYSWLRALRGNLRQLIDCNMPFLRHSFRRIVTLLWQLSIQIRERTCKRRVTILPIFPAGIKTYWDLIAIPKGDI